MSEINAGTLGDQKVADARNGFKTVLDDEVKAKIETIRGKLENVDDKGAVTTATTAIKDALEAFEKTDNYKNLSDAVKKEFIELKLLSTNLNVSASGLTQGQAATDEFKTAFEKLEKVTGFISDLNAAQTADLNEMRDKLQSFVTSPEDAKTKLDSTNFTAFIDTLDTALSKISDQLRKIKYNLNRLAKSL